jgi:hypothetical protein
MQLTTSQIDQLFTFTRQHYVEWYDLQSELVDHLADSIEAQWEQFPKRTFEEALNIEFKKFGIYGFMDVVYKTSGLNKKYYKIVWGHFKDFLVFQNYIDNSDGLSFIYCFKIECLQRIYFLWYISFNVIIMFYELYKINTKKKKTKRKNVGCLRKS